MRIRTVFDDFWTQIWPPRSQTSNRPFSELRRSWEHRFGQLTSLESIFWNFRKSYVDFHEFCPFLVFNFEETVLEAQKELSLWIGPPESSLFIFLKKNGKSYVEFMDFHLYRPQTSKKPFSKLRKSLSNRFYSRNVCLDTFFQKNKIHVRIIHFGPNLDATPANLTQEGIFHWVSRSRPEECESIKAEWRFQRGNRQAPNESSQRSV